MNAIREYWKRQLNDDAKILGLLFGLTAFLCLFSGIFTYERMGTIDTGRYEAVMKSAGLTYTAKDLKHPETLTYSRVIEEYSYDVFSYSKLFAPNGTSSIVYPIALIRFFTKPFGMNFSTVYLYVFYSLLMAYGIYSIVRSCTCLAGKWSVIPGGMLVLLAADRNLTAYFNSLYTTGTVVVSLILVIAMILQQFTYRREEGAGSLVPYLASVVFCFNASELCCVFIPFVVVATIGILWKKYRNNRCRLAAIVVSGGILISAAYSSVMYFRNSADIQSDAAAYHAAFQGFLEQSADPVKDLEELGLDGSYAADVGKSYYLAESEYAHNPRDDEEHQILFSKLNHSSIQKWYRKHPFRLMETVIGQTESFNSLESERTLPVMMTGKEAQDRKRAWSMADTMMRIFLPKNYQGMNLLLTLWFLMSAAAGVSLWIKKKSVWKALWLLVTLRLLGLGICLYVPLHILCMGRDSLELSRMCCVSALGLGVGLFFMVVIDAADHFSVWFRQTQLEPSEKMAENRIMEEELQWMPEKENGQPGLGFQIWRRVKVIPAWIVSGKRRIVFVTLMGGLFISGFVQFCGMRAGCVNNGDFGRMMEQLGLIWQGEIYFDTQAQLGRRVIEEYAYRQAFDWTSLTFLNPKYSLIYPSLVIRTVCDMLNQPFNTWYLALLLNLLLVLCIVSIVRDLYGILGRFALVLGAALCGIFLSESYLVWFNSLYGESGIFLGLFLFAACAIHLSVLKEGKGWFYVLFLMFFGRFLVCAKAQMMVTLPVVLLLILIFAFYHRPLRLRGLIPYTFAVMIGCILISYEGVRVYQDNGHISERQTVWQTVFYGALTISDDPIADMEDLGIDTRMAPDIGKDAYQPDESYVISPNSAEADEAFYNHVNTFTMVKYYLKRPRKFLQMLDYAASVSQEMYNGFRVYVGQDYTAEHDTVQKLGLWLYWRPFFAFGAFWEYVAVYGGLLLGGIFGILKNPKASTQKKLLFVVYIGIMLIGSLQYPLSVVGNGFADNHKQMFGFILCHDLLVVFTLVFAMEYLWTHRNAPWMENLRRMDVKEMAADVKRIGTVIKKTYKRTYKKTEKDLH